jgi:6,7-dimethyl-8-ribityllumazine synthase
MHRSRLAAAITAALTLGALAAASAPAATTALGGSPLNVYVGDRGQLQAFRADQPNGIFYHPTSREGDAGFFIADLDVPAVYGFQGSAGPLGLTPYTIGSQSAVTGSGSAADPLKLVTTYSYPTFYAITQTTTYVNGSQQFRIHWDVKNVSGATRHFKALAAADFYFEGSDKGTGIFTQGPPRFIGGTNADSGASGGFEEVPSSTSLSPWSAYQALPFGNGPTAVWGKVENAAASSPASFDNTVVGEQVDNAGGVEWDQYVTGGTPGALANGATASFELVARNAVPSALQFNPTNAGSRQGVPIAFTVTALDTNGQPYAGKTLRYQIVGANATTGAVTTNSAGTAVITDPGNNAGADTVIAFLDFNNDGTRQAVEPQASALGTFVDNIPPSCTVKVSGDRPGGSGGEGKPLIISVKCPEQATVVIQTSLQPVSANSRAATVDKKKKRKKKVTIKLKTRTVVVPPGKALAVSYKIPQTVRRKYAGKTVKITTTAKARDAAGNVKTAKATRTVKFAKYKKKKAGRH